MAKKRAKGDVNVSAAIREYVSANSEVGPKEAAKAISEQLGQPVSATYVSNIKSVMKRNGGSNSEPNGAQPKRRRRRRRRTVASGTTQAPAAARSSSSGQGSVDLVTLESMKQIVSRIGAKTAKQLIDILA